jgi:hypothetical protein
MPYSFDLYDYTGYIVPGAVLLLGLAIFFPWIRDQFGSPKLGLGEIGVFIIIAFILGHLLHGLGHVTIERVMHDACLVFHTDKVVDGTLDFPSVKDRERLIKKIEYIFNEQIPGSPTPPSAKASCAATLLPVDKEDWKALVQRMYVAVSAAKRNDRVDIFNRIYGLHLGLATAFGLILVMYVFVCRAAHQGELDWRWTHSFPITIMNRDRFNWRDVAMLAVALLLAFGIAVYRMNEFSDLYARELFAAFMSLDHPIQM